MIENRNREALPMAVAQHVLICALIETHPDLASLQAAVVRNLGTAEHSMGNTERDELEDESVGEAIARNIRGFLEVIRLATADRAQRKPPSGRPR